MYIVYYEIVVWCTQSFRLFYRLIQFLFSFFILNILSVENFLCFYQCICTLSYCKSCLTFLIQGCLHLRKLSFSASKVSSVTVGLTSANKGHNTRHTTESTRILGHKSPPYIHFLIYNMFMIQVQASIEHTRCSPQIFITLENS